MWAAVLACVSMLISPAALAAPPTGQAIPADVELRDGGVLIGQLVSPQGAPIANAKVVVRTGGKEIVQATTNENGVYKIAGLRGGVYEITSANSSGVYRLWAPRTAPPTASQALMMVSSQEVVRGQYPEYPPEYPAEPGPFAKAMGWIAEHPILTTIGVAAGIAIPLAIDDEDPAS